MTVQNPAIFLQEGSHPAEDVRRALGSIVGQAGGLVSGSDLVVSENSAGADLSIDVAGGAIWLAGTEAAYQGVYYCENRGVQNVPVQAADVVDPRIDLVVARVFDSAYSGTQDEWELDILTGTPDASPVAPALPANSFSLATIYVAANATTIVDANITDTRTLTDETITGNLNVDGDLTVDTDTLFVDSVNDRVGVNDSTPSYALDVDGDINATGDVRVAGNPVGMVLVTPSSVTGGTLNGATINIGSGVSSVTVTDAFSSAFENYHITYFVEDCSTTATTLQITLGSITTGYYGARQYTTWLGNVSSVSNNNQAEWGIGAVRSAAGGGGKMDIYRPYFSGTKTFMFSQNVFLFSSGYWDTFGGYQNNTASVSDITFKPSGGTISGGAIRIYGYNG